MKTLIVSLSMLFSHVLYLGVFGLSEDSYYVINNNQNLCGEFKKGTAGSPNWLPSNWEAIFLNSELKDSFSANTACLDSNVAKCCTSQSYRYAGVPIGVEYISDERKGAELLASKSIIEAKSFNPSEYKLGESITRKELMKIIINISNIEVQDNCREIFTDVASDWGCKYIESALENELIVGNDLFRPDDNVTQTEALKLVFKARGIEKSYTTQNWQEDYISTAYYRGYIDEKYSDYNTIASRGWIFSLAGNTYPEFKKY